MKFPIEENERYEYKESLAQLDKGLKSLAAMLNRGGCGTILFGIRDDGEIIGLSLGSKTINDIRQRIAELISPRIVAKIVKHTNADNVEYLEVSAQGSDIPYSCDGRYFIRTGSSDEQITPQLLRKMLESGDNDLIRNAESLEQNLTFSQFVDFSSKRNLYAFEGTNFYKSKGLYNKEGKYNLMAFLLSDQNNVSMKLVKFGGMTKAAISERTEYGYKCLLVSLEDIMNSVKAMNTTRVDLTEGIRKEIELFNFESFREAWINACLHNHWIEMLPPAVFVFDDRIEIQSYGDLPYGLSKQDFYSGLSVPVNKALKDIFTPLGLSEQSGHGVPVVVKHYGEEAFEFSSGTITVKIPFSFTPDFVLGRKARESAQSRLTANQKAVLDYLAKNPNARQIDVANELSISLQGVKKIILKLQELGLLSRSGSKKDGVWVVKVY